jgi:hypothetical protein
MAPAVGLSHLQAFGYRWNACSCLIPELSLNCYFPVCSFRRFHDKGFIQIHAFQFSIYQGIPSGFNQPSRFKVQVNRRALTGNLQSKCCLANLMWAD